jgi:acylphosphatase
MDKGVRLRIEGRVQGVGYRYWLAQQAGTLKVTGWVRNRRDGSVEAALFGPGEAVDALVERCRRGPMMAAVRSLQSSPDDGPAPATFRELATL